MSRYAIMPQALWELRSRYTDAYQVLFDEAGFVTMPATTLADIPPDATTVLLFVGAHGRKLLGEVPSLKADLSVVLYLGGAHAFANDRARCLPALNRANVILSGCDQLFRRTWPEHAKRFVFFPNFFAPHERFTKLAARRRTMRRCLLSGHSSSYTYPLRAIIWQAINNGSGLHNKVHVMQHPRWWQNRRDLQSWEISPRLGDDYGRTLGAYYCALTTASRYKYALMKYFEVPAAGALLLANDAPDVRLTGLKAGRHFVPINKYNALKTIKYVLEHRDEYEEIRKDGAAFVRHHHSVRNRAAQLEKLLEAAQ